MSEERGPGRGGVALPAKRTRRVSLAGITSLLRYRYRLRLKKARVEFVSTCSSPLGATSCSSGTQTATGYKFVALEAGRCAGERGKATARRAYGDRRAGGVGSADQTSASSLALLTASPGRGWVRSPGGC